MSVYRISLMCEEDNFDIAVSQNAKGAVDDLVPRSPEEPDEEECKRALRSRDTDAIRRRCGGGGGGGEGDGEGGGEGGEPSSPDVTGENVDAGDNPSPDTAPGDADPELVALNEQKGLSWTCAVMAALQGFEAGLACDDLEQEAAAASQPKAPSPPPTPPPSSPPAPRPRPPPPPAPPAPKKSNGGGGGGEGGGPRRMPPKKRGLRRDG